jgi:glyoxylate carboligase
VEIGVAYWELKFQLFKALVLPTFTHMLLNLGRRLENSHWKSLKIVMKIHNMSYIKVRPSTTYQILLAEFGEVSTKLYALKLTIGFQQRLAHLPSP